MSCKARSVCLSWQGWWWLGTANFAILCQHSIHKPSVRKETHLLQCMQTLMTGITSVCNEFWISHSFCTSCRRGGEKGNGDKLLALQTRHSTPFLLPGLCIRTSNPWPSRDPWDGTPACLHICLVKYSSRVASAGVREATHYC